MGIDIRKKEVQEMFEIFDDPMDKYIQIIELGKKNIPLKDSDKNDINSVFLLIISWYSWYII